MDELSPAILFTARTMFLLEKEGAEPMEARPLKMDRTRRLDWWCGCNTTCTTIRNFMSVSDMRGVDLVGSGVVPFRAVVGYANF